MKYLLNICYKAPVWRLPLMQKVNEYLGQKYGDWALGGEALTATLSVEFLTELPLTEAIIKKIEAMKEDWMESVHVSPAGVALSELGGITLG